MAQSPIVLLSWKFNANKDLWIRQGWELAQSGLKSFQTNQRKLVERRRYWETVMALGSEQGAVQNPFVKYAQQAGWVYLSPDDARTLRKGEDTSPVLDEVLIDQLQNPNPGI